MLNKFLEVSRLPQVAAPTRKAYPSDVSDAEWKVLKILLIESKFEHPSAVDLREIFNGIFYVQRTGCQWEMLPHDLPLYTTVYAYCQKWQRQGKWQEIYDRLRTKSGQNQSQTVDLIVTVEDYQCVKTLAKKEESAALMILKKLKSINAML